MITLNNYVKIKRKDDLLLNKGVFRAIPRQDMRYGQHVEEHETITLFNLKGVVEAVPKQLHYHGKRIKEIQALSINYRSQEEQHELHNLHVMSTDCDVPIEISIGDEVYFSFNSRNGAYYDKGIIPYSELVAKKTDNGLYPLNGYLLVEPIEKEELTSSGIILDWKRKERLNMSKVLYKGCLVNDYKDTQEKDIDCINVGDVIWHETSKGFPMEYKHNRELKENIHYIHRKDVMFYADK